MQAEHKTLKDWLNVMESRRKEANYVLASIEQAAGARRLSISLFFAMSFLCNHSTCCSGGWLAHCRLLQWWMPWLEVRWLQPWRTVTVCGFGEFASAAAPPYQCPSWRRSRWEARWLQVLIQFFKKCRGDPICMWVDA
jgi:hypothetical protein